MMTNNYFSRKKRNVSRQKEETIKINRTDWEKLRDYKKIPFHNRHLELLKLADLDQTCKKARNK